MGDKENVPFSVRVKLQFQGKNIFFGPGIAELLYQIQKEGSMKAACAGMELSYSKGWFILNRAEEELGYALIARNHGGKMGGGASLTEEAVRLLEKYELLKQEVEACAQSSFSRLFAEDAGIRDREKDTEP